MEGVSFEVNGGGLPSDVWYETYFCSNVTQGHTQGRMKFIDEGITHDVATAAPAEGTFGSNWL